MVTANKPGKGIGENVKEQEKQNIKAQKSKLVKKKIEENYKKERKRVNEHNSHIKKNWIEALRKMKPEELKKNCKVLMDYYEINLQKKQSKIDVFFEVQKARELEIDMAYNRFQEFTKKLVDMLSSNINMMSKQFIDSIKEIKQSKEIERTEISRLYFSQIHDLNKINKGLQGVFESMKKELEVNFMSEKELILKMYSNQFEVMKIKMNKLLNKKNKVFEDLSKYNQDKIYVLFNKYMNYRADNEKTQKLIKSHEKQKKRYQELENEWKVKHKNNIRNCKERNSKLRNEVQRLKKQYNHLKNKLNKFRNSEKARLLKLIKQSHDSIEALEKRIQVSKSIEEKQNLIIPYISEIEAREFMKLKEMDENGINLLTKEKIKEFEKKEKDENPQNWEELVNYYKKFNLLLIHTNSLSLEKNNLVQKNNMLRNKLKKYIEGITVNPELMNQKNSLLIINKIRQNYPQLRKKERMIKYL